VKCLRCGEKLAAEWNACPSCGEFAREVGCADGFPRPELPPGLVVNWVLLTLCIVGWVAVAHHQRTRVLAETALLACPALLVYNLPYLIFAPLLGLRVEEIGIGLGWQVLRFRAAGAVVRLNLLPLGTYVKYPSGEGQGEADTPPEVGTLQALHPLTRFWFTLSGPVVCALLGMALLGAQGPRSFVVTFKQFFELFYLDLSIPAVWIGKFFHAILRGESRMVIGTLATKIGAANLVPLWGFPGGSALLAIIELFTGPKRQRRIQVAGTYLGLLIIVVFFARLVIAVSGALRTL
jgi:hypothetical protein